MIKSGQLKSIASLSAFTPDRAFASIMWYLQAKSGKKRVMNPNTWEMERGFVNGGTYRFTDTDGKLFEFLESLDKVYTRKSSHFSSETDAKEKYFKHRGFDIEGGRIPLPGKKGTKTVLFGRLKDGSTFMKAETFGTNTASDTVNHLLSYVEHMKHEKSGNRVERHAHRESTDKFLKENFKSYLKEQEKLEAIAIKRELKSLKGSPNYKAEKKKAENALSAVKRKYEDYKKKGSDGLQAMIEVVSMQDNELENSVQVRPVEQSPVVEEVRKRRQSVSRMLEEYKSLLCDGSHADPSINAGEVSLKGCEAVVDLSD